MSLGLDAWIPDARISARSPSGGAARVLRDGLVLLVLAIAIAGLARSWAIEPYRISQESMLPTLHAGERVFVTKWAFGGPVPFSDRRLPAWRVPERGEVVVFRMGQSGREAGALDERPDLPERRFVKRIVGLPGDHVESRAGRLWVNGARIDAWPTGEWVVDAQGRRLAGWTERIGDREYRVVRDGHRLADFEIRVPEGRYFLIGDHREHSTDSRAVGSIPAADIIGPVSWVFWSRERADSSETVLMRPWAGMRWSRMGDWIE